MEHSQRWTAPLLAVIVAALLVIGLTQVLSGQSGIVVPTSGSWRLYRSTSMSTSFDGTPLLTNATAAGRSRVRVSPGVYWLVVEDPHQPNCPTAEEYKVRPHQWASKPSAFASHSCSVQ